VITCMYSAGRRSDYALTFHARRGNSPRAKPSGGGHASVTNHGLDPQTSTRAPNQKARLTQITPSSVGHALRSLLALPAEPTLDRARAALPRVRRERDVANSCGPTDAADPLVERTRPEYATSRACTKKRSPVASTLRRDLSEPVPSSCRSAPPSSSLLIDRRSSPSRASRTHRERPRPLLSRARSERSRRHGRLPSRGFCGSRPAGRPGSASSSRPARLPPAVIPPCPVAPTYRGALRRCRP